MSEHDSGAPAHKALRACAVALAVHAIAATGAYAQTSPAATDGAPSEAARRAAASPYRFILQHSSAPARKPAAAPEPAPAPAAQRRAPAAEAPVQSTAVRTVSEPAPAPAPEPAQQAAPAPQPEPTQLAARAPKPPEPKVRRDIVPVRVEEPKLPMALVREKPNGVVKISFEIHPDGSTQSVKVLASNNSVLNRPTVSAVSAWKFEPVDEVLTVETEIAYKYE